MKTRTLEFPPRGWLMRFVAWREWWQRHLWWLPFLQLQLEFNTPRDAQGQVVPFWFPNAGVGLNNVRGFGWCFIANAWLCWLGVYAGLGVCVPFKRPASS